MILIFHFAPDVIGVIKSRNEYRLYEFDLNIILKFVYCIVGTIDALSFSKMNTL